MATPQKGETLDTEVRTEAGPEVVSTSSPQPLAPEQVEARLKVMLVSSAGGHLLQLHRLKPWWERHDRTWVTFKMPDSLSLLADEEVAWAYHPTTRNIPNMLRNFRVAWRLIRQQRPSVVVSSGAGVAFPFFVVAKLFGARTIYIEVYDRIDLPTVTGKLCHPLSNLFLLQWEAQKRFYKRGVVIGRLL
jgi:UDP-N-acetylglucosamine:LPS N-acetylglucosamine transferase